MKILLDTHMIIWALTDSPKLSENARKIILNPENDIYISVVNLWEIEIKHLIKPDIIQMTAEKTADFCKQAGYKIIPLQENSIYHLGKLSRPDTEPPHKDPFDRMLICQAVSNGMKLLTHDSLIKGYISENILFV